MDLQFRTCSPDGRTFTYDRQEWAQRRARELVDQGFAPVVVEVGQFEGEGAWKAERVIGSAGHHIAEQRRMALEAVAERRRDACAEVGRDVLECFVDAAQWGAGDIEDLPVQDLAHEIDEEYDTDGACPPDLGLTDGEPDGGYIADGPEAHALEHESAQRLRQQTRHPQAA